MLHRSGLAIVVTALFSSAALTACGGHSPVPGEDGDAGPDAGLTGTPCNFDTDCGPPDYVCDTVTNTCTQGCTLNPNCPAGKSCNTATGRCATSSTGGNDGGGHDAGPDGGTTGVPSPTLCQACTSASDCQGGGLCVSNQSHDGHYCTQDCTDKACPADYTCTLDVTGTKHQCVPSSGTCPSSTPDGGASDGGGVDGGPVNDPGTPSDNPNGCGFCGQCQVNNDCKSGSVCVKGTCAVGPCNSYIDCALQGGLLAKCSDVGLANKYCLPLLGQCLALPPPITPLGGDVGCQPSGTNPGCAAASAPAPADGANVAVTQNLPVKPLLASEDSITRDSQGRMALGYIGVDSQGNSYMGVSQSTDDGKTWIDRGRMVANTSVQSDPVLVTSKWTDSSGPHERMHYVWVGYTIAQVNGQPQPKDMFMESSYSDDGGATWSHGIKASTTADNNNGALLLDKPWIAVSPDPSQTLIFSYSIGDNTQQHMVAVISTDHGQSWQPHVALENGDNNHGHNLGMPVFDPADSTGSTIYVVYVTYTQVQAGAGNQISLVKSTDRGAHWSAPVVVSAADDQVLFEPPSIAADQSHHLYVGYVSSPGSAGTAGAGFWDAMVATIDASGSAPTVVRRVRASDDAAGCYQHFHTMVQVDAATGHVFAGWLDNRQGGAHGGGTWYSVSSDGGATFGANKLVSDAVFAFNPDHANSQLDFLGDYFGFFFDGSKLRIAWSDPRNGHDSQVFYAGGTP